MTPSTLSRPWTVVAWVAQIVAAAILLMVATTRLTSAPDAVALFTTLGVEPWGRLALGVTELATGLLGLVLMTGAIGIHLFKIGIMYHGDPSLFVMALLVLVGSGTTAYLYRFRPSL